MPKSTLSLRALNRATLARQLLLARERAPAFAVVERLAGLQAQWARPPFLGLWSRIEGFRSEELSTALRERRVVRATMLRGTLHVTSARDYLAQRGVLQPVLARSMAAALRERARTFDHDALLVAARAYLAESPRTFEEVRDHLVARFPKGDERAMGYTVRMHLSLVQVPTDAPWGFPTVPRFTTAETWLGEPPSGDSAPDALLLRYLAAFGPASVADAQRWSGLQSLRSAFERLRPRLRTFRDERARELFDLPDAPVPREDLDAPVRFLPEFDNLLLAHDDRRRIVADVHRGAVFLPGLRVAPTFLVDGFVAGTWKAERVKENAVLAIAPFAPLARRDRAELVDEAARLVRCAEPDAASFDVHVGKSE